MRKWAISLLRGYQRYLSPLTPPSCRFHPSCSTYGIQAISRFGLVKGGRLLLRRLCKCHPFYPSKTMEVDPVPQEDDYK